MRSERVGSLDVHITGGVDGRGGGDGPLVVLLHGFGAPGTDLVVLTDLIDLPPRVRLVYPEAPLALAGAYAPGRAWWSIDVERVERRVAAAAAGQPEDPADDESDEVPDGLAAAHDAVVATLDGLRDQLSVGSSPVVLGGFSQGAMLACDVALRTDQALAGLILMSGALIAESTWRSAAGSRSGLRVFQSHGRDDLLLPFAGAERLRDLLCDAGLSVKWHPFYGGHEIPADVLDGASELVRTAMAKK